MAHLYKVESLSGDNDHLIQPTLDRFSADGWRLHSIVPVAMAYGGTRSLKMIFEKFIPVDVDSGPR